MRKMIIMMAMMLGSQLVAQEAKSIKQIVAPYEDVDFVMLGLSDTTAVIGSVNLPEELGLTKPKYEMTDDEADHQVFYNDGFRIIYTRLFDGRTSSSISRL